MARTKNDILEQLSQVYAEVKLRRDDYIGLGIPPNDISIRCLDNQLVGVVSCVSKLCGKSEATVLRFHNLTKFHNSVLLRERQGSLQETAIPIQLEEEQSGNGQE